MRDHFGLTSARSALGTRVKNIPRGGEHAFFNSAYHQSLFCARIILFTCECSLKYFFLAKKLVLTPLRYYFQFNLKGAMIEDKFRIKELDILLVQ